MSDRDVSPGSVDPSEPQTPLQHQNVQTSQYHPSSNMVGPLDPSIANLPMIEQSASASIIDMGSSSPDLDSSATIHPFGSLSQPSKARGILGNSASGKLLPSKGGRRHEQPKGIFGPAISLPKLKEFQSHKKLVKQYKEDGTQPKTFELPPYRGYQVDPSSHVQDLEVNKKTLDLLDSRYRIYTPMKEPPHLTWRLHNKLRWQADRGGKLEVRDVDNPTVFPDIKTEKEYLKEAVQLSEDEEAYDSEKKDFIGPNAIKEFNMHYKLVDKIQRENQIKKIKNSVYTEMLSSVSKKSLLPMRMNLVKSVGNLKVINNS